MRWTSLKDRDNLKPAAAADLDALIGKMAVKRSACGFTRISTIRTVIFLIIGKFDFLAINPLEIQ